MGFGIPVSEFALNRLPKRQSEGAHPEANLRLPRTCGISAGRKMPSPRRTYFGGRSSLASHAAVHGSCNGSTRSHSKQRTAPGHLPSTGTTSTIKPPQCSHRPDGKDWPMLQYDAAPAVTSNPFGVSGRQLACAVGSSFVQSGRPYARQRRAKHPPCAPRAGASEQM